MFCVDFLTNLDQIVLEAFEKLAAVSLKALEAYNRHFYDNCRELFYVIRH